MTMPTTFINTTFIKLQHYTIWNDWKVVTICFQRTQYEVIQLISMVANASFIAPTEEKFLLAVI